MSKSKTTLLYHPSPEVQLARTNVYKRLQEMRELKDKKMPHFANQFGQRSYNQFIDDSERILNGYILDRESQGKEPWQSNMLDNVTRAKLRAIVAGVGLKVPEMIYQATNKDGLKSSVRADIFKNITKQTFQDSNPTLQNFLETWKLMAHGTAFAYEGYKTGGAKVRKVKSFDSLTGEVEEEEVYVKGAGKPFSILLNPQEFYWQTFFVREIQQQPRLAWVQHYTKAELEHEFSKYPNYKYVKDKASCSSWKNMQETLYFQKWSKNVENADDYEVIRYYSKEEDSYEIWINGVDILRAPLLWGENEKHYPFAKSIAEPFANPDFFVGIPFPITLESITDGRSTIINTMIDKLYRSMETPMLVGLQNKDLLDIESEWVSQDNRYYVPDVNAVKPMPVNGVNQGELAMLQILDRGIESLSIDRAQQGLESTGDRTLGEAQLADARARELKGMLYLFLEDWWMQKYKLRTRVILTHFLKDKAAQENKRDNIVTVKDYTFSNGERGTLDIHIAKDKGSLLSLQEIEAREMAAEQMGETYKLISILSSYMDEWELDFSIIPESFHNHDKALKEEEFMGEVHFVTTLMPDFFVANKEKYIREYLEMRGKNYDEYNPPAPPMPTMLPGQEGQPTPQEPGQPISSPLDQGAQMLQ